MLSILLIKDFKLLLKDLKFQLFFLLLVALFILAAISSYVTYQAHSQEFQELSNEHIEKVNDGTSFRLRELLSRGRISVIDSPSPALLFSSYKNYHTRLTNDVLLYNPNFLRYSTTESKAFQLDWNFILGILSGFILLVLSFEAVANERRTGTLRLLSVNGCKRQIFLWSKYLSYMILYIIIIIPPALISMLLFFTLTGTWEISYMLKYFAILLLSIPFASFFVWVGIFVSMAKNYRSSIVIIVFFWLLLVVIIPQSANILGKQISEIKTSGEYINTQNKIWLDEYNTLSQKVEETESVAIAQGNYIFDAYYYHALPMVTADEKRNQAQLQELDDNRNQLQTIEKIAIISPFTQYEKISEILFDKGYYLMKFQEDTMKNTITQVRNLLIEQDSKDERSFHMLYRGAGNITFRGRPGQPEVAFSELIFDHPNLLFITNPPTDDAMKKTFKIILRLIPILTLNLMLVTGSVLKFERLDIR